MTIMKDSNNPTDKSSDLRNRLIPQYRRILENQISELERALTQNDFVSIANIAHKIKGHGGLYGFPELSCLGSTLFQMAQTPSGNSTQDLSDLVRQIRALSETI